MRRPGPALRSVVFPLLLVALAFQQVPFLSGPVVDQADMLSKGARTRIETVLQDFEQETGSQVVVLTVPSLEGTPIEAFALRVAETWQLGREGVDDGVLFLIAREERRMRLEVGYGLEGALPDAVARRILDRVVTPAFRAGDFDGGVEAGVAAILARVRGEVPAPDAPVAEAPSPIPVLVALLILILVLVWLRRARPARRRRGWSSRRGWVEPPVILRHPRPWARPWPGPRDRSPPGGGQGGWPGGRGGFRGGGGGFRGGGGRFGGGGASGGW